MTKQVIFMMGPPASGKSVFANELLNFYGMYPMHNEIPTFNIAHYFQNQNFDEYYKQIVDQLASALNTKISMPNEKISVPGSLIINKNELVAYILSTYRKNTYAVNIDDLIYNTGFMYTVINELMTKRKDLQSAYNEYVDLLKQLKLIYIHNIFKSLLEIMNNQNSYFINDRMNNRSNFIKYFERIKKKYKDRSIEDNVNEVCNLLDNMSFDNDNYEKILNNLHFLMIRGCEKYGKEDITDPFLIDKIKSVIQKSMVNVITTDTNTIKHKMDKNIFGIALSKLYWMLRGEINLIKIVDGIDSQSTNLNGLNDYILNILIKNEINFVMETVGDRPINWYYQDLFKLLFKNNYKIYAMMPIVEDDILKLRMVMRTLGTLTVTIDGSYSSGDKYKKLVFFMPDNIDDVAYVNKLNAIYKNFHDIINIINEVHLYDNRAYRHNPVYYNEQNYKLDKLYYKKNVLSCDKGFCLIIEPHHDIVYNAALQYSEKNSLPNQHLKHIKDLKTKTNCTDIALTHLKYFIGELKSTYKPGKIDIVQNMYYEYNAKNETRKKVSTEILKIMKNENGTISEYQPNIFNMIKECNYTYATKYAQFKKEILNEHIKDKIKLADLFPKVDNIDGSNEIDFLLNYTDATLYGITQSLYKCAGGLTATGANALSFNNDGINSYFENGKITLSQIVACFILYELFARKFAKKFEKYKDNNMILFKAVYKQKYLYAEKENNNVIKLNLLDIKQSWPLSLTPQISGKQVVNYCCNDWNEFIDKEHFEKTLKENFNNESVAKANTLKFNEWSTRHGGDMGRYGFAIQLFVIPWNTRCAVKARYPLYKEDPEKAGQSLEICISPDIIQKSDPELSYDIVLENEYNKAELSSPDFIKKGVSKLNSTINAYKPTQILTDKPDFTKKSYTSILTYKCNLEDKNFDSYISSMPKYLINIIANLKDSKFMLHLYNKLEETQNSNLAKIKQEFSELHTKLLKFDFDKHSSLTSFLATEWINMINVSKQNTGYIYGARHYDANFVPKDVDHESLSKFIKTSLLSDNSYNETYWYEKYLKYKQKYVKIKNNQTTQTTQTTQMK